MYSATAAVGQTFHCHHQHRTFPPPLSSPTLEGRSHTTTSHTGHGTGHGLTNPLRLNIHPPHVAALPPSPPPPPSPTGLL